MEGRGAIELECGETGKKDEGKLTFYAFVTCLVAATGGLTVGYTIGASGGAAAMLFISEEDEFLVPVGRLWLRPSDWGRRKFMLVGGIFSCAGALVSFFGFEPDILISARMLMGIGIGLITQSVPLYLSEMAPSKHRGALNMMFHLSFTIGFLLANIANYYFANLSIYAYRMSHMATIIPAIIIVSGSKFLPESPHSLVEQDKLDEAKKILVRIRGVNHDVDFEIQRIVAANEASKTGEAPWKIFRKREYRPHLVLAIAIPLFQQLTGFYVIMIYAPSLFKAIGYGDEATLVSAVTLGVVNIIASTLVAIFGVDRWGRRSLFLLGGIHMGLMQIIAAIIIGSIIGLNGDPVKLPKYAAIMVVACVCIYVVGFAWSWGPLGWLIPSEIFPLEVRLAGQSLSVSVNILAFAMIEVFFPMLCALKFGLFIFFAFFVAVMTSFVYKFLPETKNVPIEEMAGVWKKHEYWGKFIPDDDATPTPTPS